MNVSEPAAPGAASHDTPGYTEALAELDRILRELEGSDVDVDHLADRVARAAELITLCREKITAAQLRVEQVTADLDAAASTAPSTD